MPDLSQAIRELQETATVMAGIQARQASVLKDHSEWLQEHDRAIADIRARGQATDERIEKLVSGIGRLVAKMDAVYRMRQREEDN